MDGPQDLGGKDDFGPVDVNAPPFRAPWEKRQWALSKLVSAPGATIDWFRHTVECLPPHVYLSIPYFQKWNATDMALGVDAGVYSIEELNVGKAKQSEMPAPVLSVDELQEKQRGMARSFEIDSTAPPAFKVGDRVTTDARPRPGHTRLPAYARAATGTVTHHHGTHLYPDAGARGDHIGHHLYTVEFRAQDLWPECENPGDVVCIDLWEPYLASA